jgi:hypothetical protein
VIFAVAPEDCLAVLDVAFVVALLFVLVAEPGAYMRLRKSRVFSWSFFRGIFYRTIAFVKDVVRAVEQREACVCIHGMIALFAWPRRAVNPRSPQGRAVGARG